MTTFNRGGRGTKEDIRKLESCVSNIQSRTGYPSQSSNAELTYAITARNYRNGNYRNYRSQGKCQVQVNLKYRSQYCHVQTMASATETRYILIRR